MTKPKKKPAAPPAVDSAEAVAAVLESAATLAVVPGAIAAFSKTEAGLAELRGRLAGVVFDVTTKEGMTAAREARRELVSLRSTLEDARKEEKSDLIERGRLIDAEAKRVRSAIIEIEQPIDDQVRAEEARKERLREDAIRAERAEAARVQGILDGLRNFPVGLAGKSADLIAAGLEELRARELMDVPEDVRPEAIQIRNAAIDRLLTMHVERVGFEREQAEVAAERERNKLETILRGARERIAEIKATPGELYEADAETLRVAIAKLESAHVTELFPSEIVEDALAAFTVSLQRLRARLKDRTDAEREAEEERIREDRIAIGRNLIAEVNAEPSRIIAEQLTANDIAIRIRHLEALESPDIDASLTGEYRSVFETALLAMRSTHSAVMGREHDDKKRADEARQRAERERAEEIQRTTLEQAAAAALIELRRFPSADALVILKLESAIERAKPASQTARRLARKPAAKRARK